MAKHPVPKKKTSKGKTNRRYKAFQNLARKKLLGMSNLVKCSDCGEMRVQHKACLECGKYNGVVVQNSALKQEAKITTIKAD